MKQQLWVIYRGMSWEIFSIYNYFLKKVAYVIYYEN